MGALVAGVEPVVPLSLANPLDARPALRAPVDRAAERSRHHAVFGDVMTVLVGEHEVEARAVAVLFLVAADDDLVFAAEVAGLGAEAAVEAKLVFGVELDGEQADLVAVGERADEAGDLLRIGDVAGGHARFGDGDVDSRAAAVTDRVALRRRGRRYPRRRRAGLSQHDVVYRRRQARHLERDVPAGTSGGPSRSRQEEQSHGYARKRPRRAPPHGGGSWPVS